MSIVVGGVAAASLLGRPDPDHEAGGPGAGDRFVLRRRAESQAWDSAVGPRGVPDGEMPATSVSSFPASAVATVAVRAERPDVLPPTLEKSFPAENLPATARWGVSMGIGLPGTGIVGEAVRAHKIANGDSLPALAKRYLGSEDRAVEIFEANRDLLSSPDALPIGVELRIPPRDAPKSSAKHAADPPPLVPIPSRSARPQPNPCDGASR